MCERAGVGIMVAGERFWVAKQMRGRGTKMRESIHFRRFWPRFKMLFFLQIKVVVFFFPPKLHEIFAENKVAHKHTDEMFFLRMLQLLPKKYLRTFPFALNGNSTSVFTGLI